MDEIQKEDFDLAVVIRSTHALDHIIKNQKRLLDENSPKVKDVNTFTNALFKLNEVLLPALSHYIQKYEGKDKVNEICKALENFDDQLNRMYN